MTSEFVLRGRASNIKLDKALQIIHYGGKRPEYVSEGRWKGIITHYEKFIRVT